MTDDSEDPKECDCCHYQAGDRLRTYADHLTGDPYTFCDFCASTRASSRYTRPSSGAPGEAEILQAICYVGNVLLDAINGPGRSKGSQ